MFEMKLDQPLYPTVIDQARVLAYKAEDNPSKGEFWLEVWVGYGAMVEGGFCECSATPTRYIKLELGVHPLAPTTGLRKCTNSDCGHWECLATICSICGEPTAPYDGITRLVSGVTDEPIGIGWRNLLNQFLITEIVPDPVTGELVRLVPGTIEQ